MNTLRFCTLVVLLSIGLSTSAAAHKASDSLLNLALEGNGISGRWDIALRDLERAIGLDADLDGAITWGELKARHDDIAAYALARLTISSAGVPCAMSARDQQVVRHSDGAYTSMMIDGSCAGRPNDLTVGYDFLFDVDPLHRGHLKVERGTAVMNAMFSPGRREWTSDRSAVHWWAGFRTYVVEGAWHVWIGFDHMLFLLTLLLPAVLWRDRTGWRGVERFREAFFQVAAVVTWFTIAHSITLALATVGWVSLSGRWVETAIAASVIVAALNNLYPLVTRRLWAVAFGFGLVHGFGFASVLGDLGLPGTAMAVPLLGFNLGVEAGQLAVVAAFLPMAFACRHWRFYVGVPLRAGSAVVMTVAAIWLIERGFDISVIAI